jgi:hypothetical protein
MKPLAVGQAKHGTCPVYIYFVSAAITTVCNTATGAHPFSLSIKIKRVKKERDIYIKIKKKDGYNHSSLHARRYHGNAELCNKAASVQH